MSSRSTRNDPQRKYWWLILIVLPILVAVIGTLPSWTKKEREAGKSAASPTMSQQAGNVNQTTGAGNNFNNVQGNINTSNPPREGKKP